MVKKYDFDKVIDRLNTNSIKWDYCERYLSCKDLLPMWVADMDFRVPEEITDAMQKVLDRGIFGYSGVPATYYEAVIAWMQKRHGWKVAKEWITFSPGVVPAIHMLVQAFSEPGDQVILQTPVYYPFFDAVKSNNREILDNPLLLEGNQYSMNLAGLEKAITSRTRMIVLCNPQNPVSRVWNEEELRRLGELCLRHRILVVSDEIHGDIVYKGFRHVPFASLSQQLATNCVVCMAASKTFNLPGLQASNIIIPNLEIKKRFMEAVKACGLQSPNMFGIAATEAAYRHGEPWLKHLIKYLEGNIAFMKEYISGNIPGLKLIEPQGTYLVWLDFRGCGIPPERLANFAREEAKVGLEPGFIFGCKENGFERMNIACPRSILAEGLRRIAEAVQAFQRS